jgi:hypothetical protein
VYYAELETMGENTMENSTAWAGGRADRGNSHDTSQDGVELLRT